MGRFASYRSPLVLIVGLGFGAIVGFFLGPQALVLKPIGQVFTNWMMTLVGPLIFVSLAAAVAQIESGARLRQLMVTMLGVFAITGLIASGVMVGVLRVINPVPAHLPMIESVMPAPAPVSLGDTVVATLSVPEFAQLWKRASIMPLIIAAILIGAATSAIGSAGAPVRNGLHALNAVLMKAISWLMWAAPVGLGASFAVLAGVFGPQLVTTYAAAMAVYYPVTLLYFGIAFTGYLGLSGGVPLIRSFWTLVGPVAATAFGTGSSVATIPLNLQLAQRLGVPVAIRNLVIPMGSTLHMDGSCLSAVLKIVVLMGLFGGDWTSVSSMAIVVGVSLLSGMVMSGVPGGGFLGELMIITLYGFPPEALAVAALIGVLVDPIATMVNSVGDTVAATLVARWVDGPKWRTTDA